MNVGDLNTYLESFDNHLKTYTRFYDGGKIEKINNYGYDCSSSNGFGLMCLDFKLQFSLFIIYLTNSI